MVARTEDSRTTRYYLSEIIVRSGILIGYSVVKPTLGEHTAFMLSQHQGDAAVAKRHAQNLCDRLNGGDAEFGELA